MSEHYNFTETELETGDILWKVEDISLPLGGVTDLISEFIDKNRHEGYSLSIFDTLTSNTMEIECSLEEMPEIVDYVYHIEKGTPLTFVGVNSLSESYVVGMFMCKGDVQFGDYKAEHGKLKKIGELKKFEFLNGMLFDPNKDEFQLPDGTALASGVKEGDSKEVSIKAKCVCGNGFVRKQFDFYRDDKGYPGMTILLTGIECKECAKNYKFKQLNFTPEEEEDRKKDTVHAVGFKSVDVLLPKNAPDFESPEVALENAHVLKWEVE